MDYDQQQKTCPRCEEAKPVDYKAHKGKWEVSDVKRRQDPGFAEDARQRATRYRKSPTNTIRLRYLKTRYGITPEQYQAMHDRQDGLCAICRNPARGTDRRLHVDHDHATKKVRGLLCFSCNAGLGHFADRADWLLAAADYLGVARD